MIVLGKEFFKNPVPLTDHQNTKGDPGHEQARETLWIQGLHNLPCVEEKLSRCRVRDGQLFAAGNSNIHQEKLSSSRVRDGHLFTCNAGDTDYVPKTHQDFEFCSSLQSSIKACAKQRDLHNGNRLHAHILKGGLLQKDIYVGTALLHMYAKCGVLAKAQKCFEELPTRDVASWNALIAGYSQHGLGGEALDCFQQMQLEGLSPDAVTFVCILKACGSIGAIEKGEEIHNVVGRQGLLGKNVVLGNALVDMYAKCGALAKAQEVFDELPIRNAASWNALMSAYAQRGLGDKALTCFGHMRSEGISADVITFVCILKACGSIGAAEKGEEIHAEVHRQGLLEKHTVLGTALVDMYAKCGALAKAQEVFNQLPMRDVVSWNVLIAGYAQHELGNEALNCFEKMRDAGLSPNVVTFVYVLKACGSIRAADKGEEIHVELGRQGLLEKNILLGTALVDMYCKCGTLTKALKVFDELPARDVTAWNALLAGYAQHELSNEALNCFERMQGEDLAPDAVTFVCFLKACGTIRAARKGEEIHAKICRQGLLEKHTVLGTALVDMYAKCGELAKAREVFDELLAWDVTVCNALMGGYAEHGLNDEVLNCFGRMQDKGLSPNTVTFVCILKACGSMGATEKGKEIHEEVSRQGLLERSFELRSALVDMYAKCGALAKAQELFDEFPAQDVVSWTVLIAGYAQLGNAKKVFDSFSKMIEEHIEPNAVTFVVLLTACSHAGLVKEAQMYVDIMSTVYHIIPTLEHYTCMVDLYSRAGLFDKAVSMMEKVQPSGCLVLWSSLLGACRKWGNVEIGGWAFEHAVRLDRRYAASYVCMSNIYAAAGMQEDA